MEFLSPFYIHTKGLVRWGMEHFIILAVIFIYSIWFIRKGKFSWTIEQSRKYALILCLIMMVLQITKPFIEYGLNQFSIGEDLPLHLCNVMPFVLFIAYYKKSRLIWAIFFFWIIGGSSQSLFTITLEEKFPHYESLRYWIVHAGIVLLAIFGYIVMGWKLEWKDILRSILAMHIAAMFLFPLNILLDGNYFFLNAKPPGTTLYSYLPEWPTYLLCLEGLLIVIFSTIYLFIRLIENIIQFNK